MYATRLLSICRQDPNILSESPGEAPNSGYLVIRDEEIEEQEACCWGTCPNTTVKNLPFPQNKVVNIIYTTYNGTTQTSQYDKVWFIPVLDQPLSSNRYYVIRAHGKYTGQASTCSREEDMGTCCFCNFVKDVKPKVLDHKDIYQQVEIFKGRYGYHAKSIAPDGFPPMFLRRKGWTVNTSSSFECDLSEAHGLDFSLRVKLPDFNFRTANKRSKTVVVGKWYCPFVFIKEQELIKDQMKRALFYEMTLEQWWEEIYTCENDNSKSNIVNVNVNLQKQVYSLLGAVATTDNTHGIDGTIWYRSVAQDGGVSSLGLSTAIVEKMRWLQEIGGWVAGEDRDVKMERTEEFTGDNGWKRFGCFVLVERFALRRMDGTLLLTSEFRHIHQIQSKWE